MHHIQTFNFADEKESVLFLFQSANPYIVKLSILDDELALTVNTAFKIFVFIQIFYI